MCYTLLWKDKGVFKSSNTSNWLDALDKYAVLAEKPHIENLRIHDNEYGVDFINYQWERDENLIGWCSK